MPTRSKLSIFRQLCNLIPTHLVARVWGLRVVSRDRAFDRVPRLRRVAY